MDYSTGRLGEGGGDVLAAEICFTGKLGPSFVDFAVARGRRLSLTGSVQDARTSVLIALQGPAALIDAFEIACSLGPIDSRIDSWVRSDVPPGSKAREFSRRF